MIVDVLERAACYDGLGPRVAAGLRFLCETELGSLAPGRHSIAGEEVFAMVSEYRTRPRAEGRWEAHRRCLDIQCLAAGEEVMGFAPLAGLKVAQDYDRARDCLFLEGPGEFLTLRPGRFVLFMPQDAHMPGLAAAGPGRVKKIVVKARV